jgi:hypothetical protein
MAVDGTVHVAGLAVGASDAAGLGERRVHRSVERREAIDLAAAATADSVARDGRRTEALRREQVATTIAGTCASTWNTSYFAMHRARGNRLEDGRSRSRHVKVERPEAITRDHGSVNEKHGNAACALTQWPLA